MGLKGNLPMALAMTLKRRGIADGDEELAASVLADMFELAGTDRCFVKADKDEPLFVLRAKDQIAPTLVAVWIEIGALVGVAISKLEGVRALLRDMHHWRERNRTLVKVPD